MTDYHLTLPSNEPGVVLIVVDGEDAGVAVFDRREDNWEARLYPPPVNGEIVHNNDEFVCARRLRDLRALLQRRLDTDGPWWRASEAAVVAQLGERADG
jgi:hypothetical protein